MINSFKLVLKSQQKRSRLTQETSGFTLIELLIGMVLATLVITPLMTFMLNIMNSENKEESKATSEHEIQSSLDFIAQDLKQAVYIYDATGIAAIKAQLPSPSATNRVPVLVFWRRSHLRKLSDVTLLNNTSVKVRCVVKFADGVTCDQREYFVYSLVAYYLIKDNSTTWSSAARIGRFEIKDGIRDPSNNNNYLTKKDPGFKLFDLTLAGTTLASKMNAWTNDTATAAYTADTLPLVDYVDQSTVGTPALVACPTTPQRVPADGTTANPTEIYSFYACVDSSRALARVYLRGNALARIRKDATYSNAQSAYFSSANVQVQGPGLLGIE